MSRDILKQLRVLYVEDEESIRIVLARGLKRRLKELEVAVNGEDGYNKYLKFKPDVIVTDIKMPKLSGLDMSIKIREKDKKTPIIITSAHGESKTLLKAIEIGVNGYILKPIDKDKLFDTITLYGKTKILEDEIKQKDNQLVQQAKNAALGELIGNIAHQWRQPLSIISASAGELELKEEMGVLTSDTIIENCTQIVKTTQKLSKTIDYFYEASQVIDDNKTVFNILETVDSCIYSFKEELEEYNIEVIKNIEKDLIMETSKNIFFQVISNIIINSIDALELTEHKRYIFIDIQKIDNNLKISIKDTAQGINSDILSKVFEPYFTTKHQSDGKGLGLYTVMIMVQNILKGDIVVENSEFEYQDVLYKGANFIIDIKN
ncbi:MAG: hybrid sensor histidine kinase/response regulator [Campylobacterota bacterium]|nr:hybrid sensor histidine kinase/response regulator [Campylobacterota bacterium]